MEMELYRTRLWVKVAFWIALAILVFAIPASYLDYRWNRRMATEAYVHHLHGAALVTKTAIEQEQDTALRQVLLSRAVHDFHQDETGALGRRTRSFRTIQAYVVGPDAVIQASTEPAWIGMPIAEAVGHEEKGLERTLGAATGFSYGVMTHGGLEVVDLSVPLHDDREDPGRVTGALHLAGDYASVEVFAGDSARPHFYVAAALLLFFLLSLNVVMHRQVILPIQRLTRAVRAGPAADALVASNDEIGVLGRAFNQMAAEIRRKTGDLEAANQKLSESYAQLLQADKMATLGLLAGTLAHDAANPLCVISGQADLLLRTGDLDEETQASCKEIKDAAQRINRLIDGIRNFSRKGTGQPLPVDVHQSIEEALLLVGKALSTSKVRVVKEYAPGLPAVSGDPNHLEQVFMNLFQNAIQAMAQGGVLAIRTRSVEAQESGARGWPAEEGWVEVMVSDTGCGIPEEDLDRIFDSFFSTKREKGTGLGLAICRRIVEEHGGRIEARSRVGAGTQMYVRLPAVTRVGAVAAGPLRPADPGKLVRPGGAGGRPGVHVPDVAEKAGGGAHSSGEPFPVETPHPEKQRDSLSMEEECTERQ
jgi:signal transduction histidine kinase